MIVRDLLYPGALPRGADSPLAMSPLTDNDALQEAQLLEVRFEALTGVAGLLFDLRQSLQIREATTGVLIARGVRQLLWDGPPRSTPLTAWSIGSSVPVVRDQLFAISLNMWPYLGARLTLLCSSAEFTVGHVPGMLSTPPDYGRGDRRAIDSEPPDWSSVFVPVGIAVHPAKQLP